MKKHNQLKVWATIVVFAALVILLIAYRDKKTDRVMENDDYSAVQPDRLPDLLLPDEDLKSPSESGPCGGDEQCFVLQQPVAIRGFDTATNGTLIMADYVSYNPKWRPGDDSSGGLYLNKGSKVLKLLIPNDVKIFTCGENGNPSVLYKGVISDYVQEMKNAVARDANSLTVYNLDIGRSSDGWDGNIAAVYEQCLP